MPEPTNKPAVERQLGDFAPEAWDCWAYTFGPQQLGYARGVAYFSDIKSLEALDERGHKEGRLPVPSETRRTITRDGIYVGVWTAPLGSQDKLAPLLFEKPVPLDDATSGEQAPLVARYPRVVFPAEGQHKYGFVVIVDKDEAAMHQFGISHEEHTVTVHRGATSRTIRIPSECPCDQEVRKAIAALHNSYGQIPEGDYKIQLEVERLPIVSIRLDGGRPFCSRLLRDGELKLELPVMDVLAPDISAFSLTHEISTERESPFRRRLGRGAKYAEVPQVVSYESGVLLDRLVLLTQGGQHESADLVYESLRRGESVAAVRTNPNLGLVEVQFGRVAKITRLNIEYTPREVPGSATNDIARGFDFGFGGPTLMRGGGGYTPAAPVNIGRSTVANPKVEASTPMMEAEWDGHVSTFRFMLTNQIT